MAELVYDGERLVFTKEMQKEYTILMPMMLPMHFALLERIFNSSGLHVELLQSSSPQIVNEGLQNVHNDTCYPALLVIGQMMDAIKSGKYDLHKIALIITQTGGGCRASNYIHLLRKALKRNGLEFIPVISFNLLSMEKNPGFQLSLSTIIQLAGAVAYGDMLTLLANQIRPYEVNPGQVDALCTAWIDKLMERKMGMGHLKQNITEMIEDFARVPINKTPKIRVGVVGEIYIKYAPLGNNNLEAFLRSENCEVMVPGLMNFIIFMSDHHVVETKMFGVKHLKGAISGILKNICNRIQETCYGVLRQYPQFSCPMSFADLKALVKGYVSYENKMGEGWLLPAEMLELIEDGVDNIVCTQPFGCLPNHIVGKGMLRKIRENHPQANIVAIDYDPGATKINQENRIKLMLAIAKQNQKNQKPQSVVLPSPEMTKEKTAGEPVTAR